MNAAAGTRSTAHPAGPAHWPTGNCHSLGENEDHMSNFSDGFIHVDYNHADNAGQDMIQQSQAIATIVSNLEMELNELKESWIGDDKDVYARVQAAWNQAVENISKLLSTHSALLGDISGDYQRREASRVQSWSTVKIGG